MPKKKKYVHFICKDCDIDFMLSRPKYVRVFCPVCGENLYTEKIREQWFERPFNYKRPWTDEEDEFILMGVKAGYTYRQVSEGLDGRTEKAVTRRLQLLRAKGKSEYEKHHHIR